MDTAEGEIATYPLDAGELRAELARIAGLLSNAGLTPVEAWFGWGCDAPPDALWKPRTLAPEGLVALAEEGVATGLLELGDGDFGIDHAASGTHVLFCHEADVHVRSDVSALLASVLAGWKACGWRVNRREAGVWREV